jgi:ribosome-associated protein
MTHRDTPLADSRRWAVEAARAAAAKGGADAVILWVADVLAITDAFVVVSASNTRLVRTIVEEVERALKAADGPSSLRVEGQGDAQWVLLDYGDFVVHVFLDEVRRYYELERLWGDVPRVEWEPAPAGQSAMRS